MTTAEERLEQPLPLFRSVSGPPFTKTSGSAIAGTVYFNQNVQVLYPYQSDGNTDPVSKLCL